VARLGVEAERVVFVMMNAGRANDLCP